jgi:hypothetical protein
MSTRSSAGWRRAICAHTISQIPIDASWKHFFIEASAAATFVFRSHGIPWHLY